ncbi:MAG: transposase [Synechococcaceae cyanobacterium SM2_3_1]|nr:transposase [Synechococcaceae cyanobacterium SM2_3_1]
MYSDAIKTIRNHLEGICQYFANRSRQRRLGAVTSGVMEGINNRIKVIKRQGYGFTNIANFRARLLAAFWP